MKGINLLCALLFVSSLSLYAQEKERAGSYLTVSGALGSGGLNYKVNSLGEKGTRKSGLGYGIDVRYSYFFNNHWGVTSGVGFSSMQTTGKLRGSLSENSYYNLGQLTDNDWQPAPQDFELRARLTHLEERQTTYLVEVPLMLSYQVYIGEAARWGMYGGLGAKVLLPVSAKYKIRNGANSEFNVSGYYEGIPVDMGSPENPAVPQHGYGTITDPNSSLSWDDKAKLKMGIAATAELGFISSLGDNTDLLLGGYIDYGLNDMKKNGNQGLFTAPAVYHPAADGRIGNGIQYNGMVNSNVTDKIRILSFGIKIGLKFKL